MKAMRFHQTGGPEVLQLEELPTPSPQADQVLVRVEAAGVNYADTVRRRGMFYPRPTPLPFIPGGEVVGVVEAVGDGVASTWLGKRVMGVPDGGGYAEYAAVPLAATFAFPDGLEPAIGVALMIQGLTAAFSLKGWGPLRPGCSVLVEGAAGGVGSLAIQLAKLYGAGTVVAAASSQEKRDFAMALGADAAVDYTQPGWADQVVAATHDRGADVVLEMMGGEVFEQAFDAMAFQGRMVVYGFASGQPPGIIAVAALMMKGLTVSTFRLPSFLVQRALVESTLAELGEFVRQGRLKIQIGKVYPIARAADAHRDLESRQTQGKLVLVPGA